MKKELKEKIIALQEKYKIKKVLECGEASGFLSVFSKTFLLATGDIVKRDGLVKKGGGSSAFILPVTKTGKLVLICEPRVFSSTGVGFALPAGYIESGETALDCAKRELVEETGYKAEDFKEIASFYQDIACSPAENHIFVATGCERLCEQELDDGEHITFFEVDFDDAVEMVKEKIIYDAPSIVAIEYATRKVLDK